LIGKTIEVQNHSVQNQSCRWKKLEREQERNVFKTSSSGSTTTLKGK